MTLTAIVSEQVNRGTDLAPVVEDMSAWIIAGAVASEQADPEFETVSRTGAGRRRRRSCGEAGVSTGMAVRAGRHQVE